VSGSKVLAWFVAWRCGCAQTTTVGDPHQITALPMTCPGHNAERIAKPEQLDVLTEYANTHLCGEAVEPCSQAAA